MGGGGGEGEGERDAMEVGVVEGQTKRVCHFVATNFGRVDRQMIYIF